MQPAWPQATEVSTKEYDVEHASKGKENKWPGVVVLVLRCPKQRIDRSCAFPISDPSSLVGTSKTNRSPQIVSAFVWGICFSGCQKKAKRETTSFRSPPFNYNQTHNGVFATPLQTKVKKGKNHNKNMPLLGETRKVDT